MLREKYRDQPAKLIRLANAHEEIAAHRAYSANYGYVFFVLRLR
jgi:hypothetical protein